MGLFNHKKPTSPSGFFVAETTPTEEKGDVLGRSKSTAKDKAASAVSGAAEERRASKEGERGVGGSGATGAAAAGAAAAVGGESARERRRSTTEGTAVAGTSGVERGAVAGNADTTTDAANIDPVTGKPILPQGVPVSITDGIQSAEGGAHIKEHALPPGHHHAQPKTDAVLTEEQARTAEHDHKYLQPVVHERRHIHQVEEIERHRVIDRHVHHVQHHVQPLVDERHLEVVHSYREVPVTHVEESHANTAEEKALLARLNAQSISTYTIVPHERVTVDKGETQVVENVIHHYHTIVQPVWQRDLHEYYRLNSNFSPETVINRGGSATAINNASPAAQAGYNPSSYASVSHPPGATVVPPSVAGPSMMAPPPPREGHRLVADEREEVGGESTRYEVEFVNREPVFHGVHAGHGRHGEHGLGNKSNLRSAPAGSLPTTVGGHGVSQQSTPAAASTSPAPATAQSSYERGALGQSGLQHGAAGQSGLGGVAGQSGLQHGATGQSGFEHGTTGQSGLERGVERMNLGVAR
ncbi:hypothetical protein NBRC10512v2_001154 [Rhodotorula toruloides]|uniref:RHTO0S02e02080g1_1 n=1 Tax=Rhodotorula toruloides TaxID=5286 RepID=A0A061AH73_RHOTO|nr:RHTO0S02e02080g1_1 [Rhodotorula toruloides]